MCDFDFFSVFNTERLMEFLDKLLLSFSHFGFSKIADCRTVSRVAKTAGNEE